MPNVPKNGKKGIDRKGDSDLSMIQVKIFVTTQSHNELEHSINHWINDNPLYEVKDIKFNDGDGSIKCEASYSAMVIYEN